MTDLTFEKRFKNVCGKEKHLLLGNGFYHNRDFYKIVSDKSTGGTLLDITQKYQDKDIFPLVVTEGESQNKLDFINENDYLQYCYNKLSEISGVLFIHGHSLNETDQHIFDAINKNLKIKKYI